MTEKYDELGHRAIMVLLFVVLLCAVTVIGRFAYIAATVPWQTLQGHSCRCHNAPCTPSR